MIEDPFLSLRPSWLVSPEFGTLSNHFHELVFFFLFYVLIFQLSQYLLPRLISAARWNALKPKDQIYFHIHVVSFIQCLVILAIILPFFFIPELDGSPEKRVFAYVPYGGVLGAASSGYFIWDAFTAVRYIKLFGPGFAIHGIVSFAVCFISFEPYILYYAPLFLLFEISTPFLNIRWFDLKLPGLFSEKVILANNVILILLFFFVRICWGWYWIYQLAWDFWLVRHDPRFNLPFSLVILIGNLVLDVLNVYWFSLMARIAAKTIAKMVRGEKGLQIDEETIKKKQ